MIRGYQMSIDVYGPLAAPEVALSSVPPLPSNDLLVMLVTGDPPTDINATNARVLADAEKVSVFIGQDLLGRIFGPNPAVREAILQRIQVEPATGISDSGHDTFEVRFVLAERMFGKSDQLAVEFARDRYDDFNAGFSIILRLR